MAERQPFQALMPRCQTTLEEEWWLDESRATTARLFALFPTKLPYKDLS
jgi:hypothetical protein